MTIVHQIAHADRYGLVYVKYFYSDLTTTKVYADGTRVTGTWAVGEPRRS